MNPTNFPVRLISCTPEAAHPFTRIGLTFRVDLFRFSEARLSLLCVKRVRIWPSW